MGQRSTDSRFLTRAGECDDNEGEHGSEAGKHKGSTGEEGSDKESCGGENDEENDRENKRFGQEDFRKDARKEVFCKETVAKSGGSKTAKESSGGRKYSPDASRNVEREMHEMHQGQLTIGKSGKKVTNPKQAIAIALSEARRAGEKVPPKPEQSEEVNPVSARGPLGSAVRCPCPLHRCKQECGSATASSDAPTRVRSGRAPRCWWRAGRWG